MYISKNRTDKIIKAGGIRYGNNPIIRIEIVFGRAKVFRLNGSVKIYSPNASRHVINVL